MIKSLFPVVVTPKLTQARDFYVHFLGFRVVFEAEWYVQLHLDRAGESPLELAFMLADLEDQIEPVRAAFSGEGVILTLDFDDVDAVHEDLVENDAIGDIVLSIRDEPWGQRHFMFRDPAGLLVDAVQLIAPSPEYAASYSTES